MLEYLQDGYPIVVALARSVGRDRDACPVGLVKRAAASRPPAARVARTVSSVLAELARPPEHSAPLLARGTRIKRFQIVRPLATGGSATVYEALDPAIARHVALKLYHRRCTPEDGCGSCMLEEARAAARLQHPNAVALFDVGQHRGHPYLVLELLRGETLAARLLRGPLTVREALRASIAIAEVLALAHRRGLVHGDVKPSNVFLTREGAVKLLDFGLSSDPRAAPQEPAGTLPYMAPELLSGGESDARADVFAAATVLRESLAPARRPAAQGAKRRAEPAQKPLRPPPRLLTEAIASAVAPDPRQRPADGAAWLEQLRRLRDIVAPEPSGRRV